MTRDLRALVWPGIGLLVGLLLFGLRPVAHALPEYATRTGEPCATCHVNPAGGGARTVRGSLWIAAGKPDKVPLLPGSSQPAGGTAGAAHPADGAALYTQFGCSGCHGAAGEGGAGPALNRGQAATALLSQVIRNGRGGMTGYKSEALSDGQLAVLITYLQAIGRGEVKAQAKAVPHSNKPASARCYAGEPGPGAGSCGGN